jgi:hypothetical protein
MKVNWNKKVDSHSAKEIIMLVLIGFVFATIILI